MTQDVYKVGSLATMCNLPHIGFPYCFRLGKDLHLQCTVEKGLFYVCETLLPGNVIVDKSAAPEVETILF